MTFELSTGQLHLKQQFSLKACETFKQCIGNAHSWKYVRKGVVMVWWAVAAKGGKKNCLLRHESVIAHRHTPKMILSSAIFSTPKSGKIIQVFKEFDNNTHLQHT